MNVQEYSEECRSLHMCCTCAVCEECKNVIMCASYLLSSV